MWACQPEAKRVETAAVKASAQRAIQLTRPDHPATSRYLQVLLANAESASIAERNAWGWNRDPEREAAAWDRLARAAWEGARRVSLEDAGRRERWQALAPLIAEHLHAARTNLRAGAGLGAREGSAMQRAQYHAKLAENLAAQGDLEAAVKAAEQALAFADVVDEGWQALRGRFDDRRLLRQWRSWVNQTILNSKQQRSSAIVVDKLRRQLHVYDSGRKIATYSAELGGNGLRPKRHAGDRATPEGRYKVTELRANGATKFYKALMLDYPNREDVARFQEARRKGTIPARVGIGSLIEVHGHGGDGRDWTDGCVALSNKDMDKVYARARVGTPVVIVGTL